MKLMDEVAGIVAARHCNTNVVTVAVDAIDFHRKIKKGEWCKDGNAVLWLALGCSLMSCTLFTGSWFRPHCCHIWKDIWKNAQLLHLEYFSRESRLCGGGHQGKQMD